MASATDKRRKFDVKFKQQVLQYSREHSGARIPYGVQVVNDERVTLDNSGGWLDCLEIGDSEDDYM